MSRRLWAYLRRISTELAIIAEIEARNLLGDQQHGDLGRARAELNAWLKDNNKFKFNLALMTSWVPPTTLQSHESHDLLPTITWLDVGDPPPTTPLLPIAEAPAPPEPPPQAPPGAPATPEAKLATQTMPVGTDIFISHNPQPWAPCVHSL